jgi:hypothetical protein
VGRGDVDWIDLAQDRNRWRALVNSVLNLRVVSYKVPANHPSIALLRIFQRVFLLDNDV